MSMNITIRQNKLPPGWRRQKLMAVAMLICLSIFGKQAAAINTRGMEYGDISMKELVSVYQEAYIKAGFTVTVQTTQDDIQKTRLSMRFLPKDKTQKHKGTLELVFYPLKPTQPPSPACMPCAVSTEDIEITTYETGQDYGNFEDQMEQSRDKADEEIAKALKRHIWYNPADGVPTYVKLYDKISVLDFVSTFKAAYAAAGFKFNEEHSHTKLTEDKSKESRELNFIHTKDDHPKPEAYASSRVYVYSPKSSYWCEPCSFSQSPDLNASYEGDVEALYAELKEKDLKARELATAKLAKCLRVRPRRDITNDSRK